MINNAAFRATSLEPDLDRSKELKATLYLLQYALESIDPIDPKASFLIELAINQLRTNDDLLI